MEKQIVATMPECFIQSDFQNSYKDNVWCEQFTPMTTVD